MSKYRKLREMDAAARLGQQRLERERIAAGRDAARTAALLGSIDDLIGGAADFGGKLYAGHTQKLAEQALRGKTKLDPQEVPEFTEKPLEAILGGLGNMVNEDATRIAEKQAMKGYKDRAAQLKGALSDAALKAATVRDPRAPVEGRQAVNQALSADPLLGFLPNTYREALEREILTAGKEQQKALAADQLKNASTGSQFGVESPGYEATFQFLYERAPDATPEQIHAQTRALLQQAEEQARARKLEDDEGARKDRGLDIRAGQAETGADLRRLAMQQQQEDRAANRQFRQAQLQDKKEEREFRREERERDKARPKANELETLTDLQAQQTALRSVLDEKPNFDTGPVADMWSSLKKSVGYDSPEFARLTAFKSQVGRILASYMKSISGAAVSESEAKRLIAQMPTFADNDDVFVSKARSLLRSMKEAEDLHRKKLIAAGRDLSSFPPLPSAEIPATKEEADAELQKLGLLP